MNSCESIKLPIIFIDVDFGEYDKRYDGLIFNCLDFDIEVDVTIYFNHYYDDETNYYETSINEVYIHSYNVWDGSTNVDLHIPEENIKSSIVLS